MIHSPFHICEDLLSPLSCEKLVKQLALSHPCLAENGQPLKYERLVPDDIKMSLLRQLDQHFIELEKRYDGVIADKNLLFQQYWENSKAPAEALGCESSKFTRKKWVKVKDVDLVGFIWLKDFHASVPLDPRFEVYGGKLEFPAYNFSLTPQRGTMVVFPATPHFITAISHIMFGSLEQIKISIKLTCNNGSWTYNPVNFPGTYQDWFF